MNIWYIITGSYDITEQRNIIMINLFYIGIVPWSMYHLYNMFGVF